MRGNGDFRQLSTYSEIQNASSIIITDNEIDTSSIETLDLSEAQDQSVLGYLDGTTYYITSNKKGQKVIASSDFSWVFNALYATEINIKNLDMTNVTKTTSMFNNCKNLETIALPSEKGFLYHATDISYMFANCPSLVTINLKLLDTSNVQNIKGMFFNDSSLKSIYVGSEWNLDNITNDMSKYMFVGCTSLPNFDASYTDKTKAIHYCDGGYLDFENKGICVINTTTTKKDPIIIDFSSGEESNKK